MRALVVSALLCVSATAWGQPEGGGDELPPMLKNPRMVSGFPRPEQGDPVGQLTVRAVQGGFRRTEFGDTAGDVPDAPIHLVSIDRKGVVSVKTATLDKGGRVTFSGLATDGSISYWVLAVFARDGGVEDRVMSRASEGRTLVLGPAQILPGVGQRMMLAGAARGSTEEPIDDLLETDGIAAVPAGQAWIDLDGATDEITQVELLEVGNARALAKARPTPITRYLEPRGRMDDPKPDAALADGTVEVRVARRGAGVANIPIELIRQADKEGAEPVTTQGVTDATGTARFAGQPPGVKVAMQATIHGRELVSPPFDVPAKGGVRATVEVDWLETDALRATFEGVAPGKDKVYVARAVAKKRVHLSQPFQLTAQRGAAATMLVLDGIAMSFHGGGEVEDERLGLQIQFTIYNPSVVPYDPGPEGLRIPLPRGASGTGVDPEIASRVHVTDDALVWKGAIAPGQKDFIGGFSLPIEDGVVHYDVLLPNGTIGSQLLFEDLPGVRYDVPAGVKREEEVAQDGRRLVKLGNIRRRDGESLTFRIVGLPQHAAWTTWARRGVSVVVLLLVGWFIVALVLRLRGGRTRVEELEAQREELLQALVQLEADHERKKIGDALYQKKRTQLAQDLEAIYAEQRGEGAA
ncbi:MAG TPA: hypothetical protein VMZ28_03865 [Kofleriaceae bacterium]|nr:hypothetical protein [Kofleriaceae bacterium]